jgi:hypothetical protein
MYPSYVTAFIAVPSVSEKRNAVLGTCMPEFDGSDKNP